MNKKKILLICGPSGCGKSYITGKLIESGMFIKLPQYTTRDVRVGESPFEYHFVSPEHYKIIKHTLVAKTNVRGNLYGTVPVFVDNKIGIVIVNKLGIQDFKLFAFGKDIEIFTLGIDSTIPTERLGRDEKFVEQERFELKGIPDSWLYNTKEKFITYEDVIERLVDRKFI